MPPPFWKIFACVNFIAYVRLSVELLTNRPRKVPFLPW